jgi:hypothetical protein
VTSTLARAVLLAVLALGTAGCQLRVGVDIDVDRNGGGMLAVSVGADEELLTRVGQVGVDPLSALLAQGRQLAKGGWRVTETMIPDEGREVRLVARFRDPEEFNVLTDDLAEALAAPEVRLLEPFTLQVSDDRITVVGAAGLQPTDAITEAGIQPADAVRLATEENAIAYDVRVRLPGEVLEATTQLHDRKPLVWQVRPGQRVEIRAVGTRPPRPWLPIVAAAAVALAATAVAVAAVLRRRRRERGRTRV